MTPKKLKVKHIASDVCESIERSAYESAVNSPQVEDWEKEIDSWDDVPNYQKESFKKFVQQLLLSDRARREGELVEMLQVYAQNLTGHGKLPSIMEIQEQIKYYSRKSDHKYHEVAGKLLAICDVLQFITNQK